MPRTQRSSCLPQLAWRLVRCFSSALAVGAVSAWAADGPKRSFDLPSGGAEGSLRRFSEQAGIHLIFKSDITDGIRTKAVKGELSIGDAADLLLKGTNLKLVSDETTGFYSIASTVPPEGKAPHRPSPPADNGQGNSLKKNDPPPQPMKRNRLLARLTATAALVLGPLAAAQVAPGAGAAPAGKRPAEEAPIELSPFEVRTDGDVGYLATNTLAGSRLNTELKDTAASISVFTEEFIRDLGAIDLSELMPYAANAQFDFGEASDDATVTLFQENAGFTSGSNANYRVRGVRATTSRNYFEWDLSSDTYNLGRVEDSRGPNAVLFGFGSAGGLINVSTKEPVFGRSSQSAAFSIDKYGSKRGTLDFSRSCLNQKLAVQLNLLKSHSEPVQNYAFDDREGAFLSAKYRILPTTTVRAEYDRFLNNGNRQRVGTVLDAFLGWDDVGRPTVFGINATTPGVAADAAKRISRYAATAHVAVVGNDGAVINFALQNLGSARPGFNNMNLPYGMIDMSVGSAGPGSTFDISSNTASVFLNHQFGTKTFMELAFNHQDQKFSSFQPLEFGLLRGDPNLRRADLTTNPFAGRLHLDSQWVNWNRENRADYYRASLTREFDFGKWGNYRIAALGELSEKVARSRSPMQVWYDDATGRAAFVPGTPESSANFVFRRLYVTEGAWETYYVPDHGDLEHVYEPVTKRTLSARWVDRNNGLIDRRDHQTTGMIGGQARYFQNRLVAGFGFRKDKLETRQYATARNPDTSIFLVDYDPTHATTQDFNGETSTLGLVYHVTPWLSLRGNRSYNLALPNTAARVLGTQVGTPVGATGVIRYGPLPEGNGTDVGINLTLFDGKIHLRATYFESFTDGATGFVFTNNTSPTGLLVGRGALDALVAARLITAAKSDELEYYADGTHQSYSVGSEGWEFGVTANPTTSWRLQANISTSDGIRRNLGPEVFVWWAENKAYFEKFPLATLMSNRALTLREEFDQIYNKLEEVKSLDGRSGSGGRKYKVNVFTSYAFKSGRLKGLTVGGGYQHQSKLLIRRDLATDREIYGNSFWDSHAMLRRQFRFQKKRFLNGMSVQLNVTNLFDNIDPLQVRKEANGLVVRYVVRQPRSWRLTTNFSF